MKKRIRQWAALCAAVGITDSTVMGCGSSASKPGAGSGQISREAVDGTRTGSGGGAHIGIIFIEAGPGDNSFNDLTLEGIKRTAADYRITYDEVEPKSVPDEKVIQDEMVTSGDYDLVIYMGAEQMDVLTDVVSTYSEQRFALLGTISNLPNVASYPCREQGGVFPADALATLAKQERTGDKLGDGRTIRFIGSVDNPLTNRFTARYKAGTEYIEPEMKVLVDYTDSSNDPTTAKTIANTFVEEGADAIFHTMGASGMGMFQAAEEKGFAAIGANLNQNSVAPDYIMASMPKKLDSCAYYAIANIMKDTYAGESQMLGLSDGDVDVIVEGGNTKIFNDILTRLDELKQKTMSGEIQVPSGLN